MLAASMAFGSPAASAKSSRRVAPTTAAGRKGRHVTGASTGRASARKTAKNPDEVPAKLSRRTRSNRAEKSRSSRRYRRNATLDLSDSATLETATLRTRRSAMSSFQDETLPGMAAPLRGSLESLERQNVKTEADDLERIENDDDLNDRIARGVLVPVPTSSAMLINGRLPENRRYCRPWTASFLSELTVAHKAAFVRPLEVTSAVRTVEFQKKLMRVNGNAAEAEGDIASPHLTGATIDIAKTGMSRQEIGWMRTWLLPLEQAGKIDVEEEFRQACFHITVYKSYSGLGSDAPTQTNAERAAPANSGS
jgi:hypothetical protein